MKNEEKIKKEIEKTLSQFEKIETLEPNPFLYTRIQQRINEQGKSKISFSTILKPAFFSVLFAFNIFTTIWYMSSTDEYFVDESNQGLVEVLSSDFNLENDQSDILIVE